MFPSSIFHSVLYQLVVLKDIGSSFQKGFYDQIWFIKLSSTELNRFLYGITSQNLYNLFYDSPRRIEVISQTYCFFS